MIDSLKATLTAAGLLQPQIRHEVFEAAIAASADSPPRRPSPPERGRVFHLSCAGSNKRIDIRPGQTLLEAAESAGVEIPSLCRAGVCGTCRVRVTTGEVECDSATLSAEEVEEGIVLACVTTARSDCAVAL
jgi:NADH oxidoreductase Hcr